MSVAGSVESFEQRLRAATLAVPDHAAASHRSAARLHGLDGFEQERLIELSVDSAHRWRFGGDVVAHHVAALGRADVTEIDGIAVTTLARTLCDLGSVCRPDLVAQALTWRVATGARSDGSDPSRNDCIVPGNPVPGG